MADVVMDTSVLDRMRANLESKAEMILDKVASDAVKFVQDAIVSMDVVDTGNLLSTINDKAAHPKLTRYISDATEYGLYQHEGFHFRNGRYFPGRPFMSLGIQRIRPYLAKAMENLLK